MRMLTMVLMTMVGIFSYAGTNISLRFSSNDAGTISSNTTFGDFTVYATESKQVSVDAQNATIGGVTFTHKLNLKGGGDSSYRIVGFHVDGPCTIRTYGQSNSSTSNRWLVLSSSTTTPMGNALNNTYCISQETAVVEDYSYTGEETNIYIRSYSNGYSIYGIDVIYGSGGDEPTQTLYTVSFNANTNGTCSTSSLTEASEGAGVTLPTATPNNGYNFLGWSASSTATTASYSAGATYNPSANITLYAVYESTSTNPAAGSAMTFDATKRYSEWVINSRLNDFKANTNTSAAAVCSTMVATNCTFRSNYGQYVAKGSIFYNCTFTNNTTTGVVGSSPNYNG